MAKGMPNTSAGVKSVSQLKTAADLTARLDALKTARGSLEAQWKLNIAFYKGKQYTYYNKQLKRLQSLPTDDGEKPRYRVRLVNNQIAPGVHALLAKLTKTKPVIHATPSTGSDQDQKAAQVADKLLEHWWTDMDLDDKLSEALLWSIVTGQGFWKITWDKHAGKPIRFLMDPEQGQPITDFALEDLFRANLRNAGVEAEAFEKVFYLGDIKVEPISPFDVYLDDTAKVFDECNYAICVHYLSPDEIKERWGKSVEADSINFSPEAPGVYGGLKSSEPNVKAVNIGYFRPQPALPNGRYVIWIDDDEILEDQQWPYPFEELPLIKFPGIRVPGSIYDIGDVEPAIPIQKDLNKTLSQIVEYKNLTVKPRIWAPTGSLGQGVRLTTEPGVIYEYNPTGLGEKPEPEKLPTLPPYIFEHLNLLRTTIREMFGIVDITEGTPPPNVEAGIAIDLLQEMATDRLAPRILLQERALSRAGTIMIKLGQEYYQEPRILKISGSGTGSATSRFVQADFTGGVNVRVETGSALPRTRAGRQARIMQYIESGFLRPDMAYKYLDIADLEGLGAKFKADEDQAYREHDRIIEGGVVNQVAAEQAMMAIQTGQAMLPDGQPVRTPEQAQQFVKMESLKPNSFEVFQTHLDVHSQFMKSPEFESLPSQIKNDFIQHFNMTQQALLSIPKPIEYQAVRPTLQIKATAGPTPISKILDKAGVPVTPQELTEPPLETWVTDSMDKPDMDSAGNDQLTMADLEAKKLDMEMKLADAAIRSGNADMSNLISSSKHDRDAQRSDNEDSRAEELHQQALRKAAADADLAEKKASQSDFSPSDGGG